MHYAFARDANRIMAADFDPSFKVAGETAARIGHFIKQFPWMLSVMQLLPDSVQTAMEPDMAVYIKLQQVSRLIFEYPRFKPLILSFLLLFKPKANCGII
jgi:hypothetical protein